MIRNIQLRHAGKYTCAVQTKVDSSSIAIDLIVRGEILQPHPSSSVRPSVCPLTLLLFLKPKYGNKNR